MHHWSIPCALSRWGDSWSWVQMTWLPASPQCVRVRAARVFVSWRTERRKILQVLLSGSVGKASTVFLYPVQNGFVFFLLLFIEVNSLDGSSFRFSCKELVSAFKHWESGIIIKADADCWMRWADRKNCFKKTDPPHSELHSPRDGSFCSVSGPHR